MKKSFIISTMFNLFLVLSITFFSNPIHVQSACPKGSTIIYSSVFSITLTNNNTCNYYIKYCHFYTNMFIEQLEILEIIFLDKNCVIGADLANSTFWNEINERTLDDFAAHYPNYIPICNPLNPSAVLVSELTKSMCWYYYSDSSQQQCYLKSCEDGLCYKNYNLCWNYVTPNDPPTLQKTLVNSYAVPGSCGDHIQIIFNPYVNEISECFNTCY